MTEKKIESKIQMTNRAAERIREIMMSVPEKKALRIAIEGGGCSGFSYKFELASEKNEDDFLIENNGATILIDPISMNHMKGSTIDFVEGLMEQSFHIDNPAAVSSCGCGVSFSL